MLGQIFVLVFPGIGIAFVIALFSLKSTLPASVEEQMRPIGVLRAVGGTRRQLAWSFMLEAGAAGLFAGLLGIIAGSLVGCVSGFVLADVFHAVLLYRFPTAQVVFALVTSAVLSAAAGYLPGSRAANVDLVTALSWE